MSLRFKFFILINLLFVWIHINYNTPQYHQKTIKIDLFYLFLQKLPLFPKYFVLLQRYLPLWLRNPNRREEPLGGALHIERRYWRFVFGLSEISTFQLRTRTNAEVTATEMYIRLRSVLRGYLYPHKHTLRCSIYSNVGVLCLFFSMGRAKPRKANRQ